MSSSKSARNLLSWRNDNAQNIPGVMLSVMLRAREVSVSGMRASYAPPALAVRVTGALCNLTRESAGIESN